MNRTEATVRAQPEWLRALQVTRRLPTGARVVHTGCGTSFHAAQTGGRAVQALDAAVDPPVADVLVCVSHEGETELTLQAAERFEGAVWLVTGAAESPLAKVADEVIVCTPSIETSWCHTASYTCGVTAIQQLHGADTTGYADAVEAALAQTVSAPPQEKIIVVGSGLDWPTAQEAALKLREGAQVDAVAYQTEQILHGYLAPVDESYAAYVLLGEAGLRNDRADEAVKTLEAIGCSTMRLPGGRPVADIVFFHLLTLSLAKARGVDPDSIGRAEGTALGAAAGVYPA
jgi:glucosamine--fructose-6-phosphate aminotransferase (isomerizing)